jgi:ribosomal protein S18 acetylase RimI-like enzyme
MSGLIEYSIIAAIRESQAFLWVALYYAAHMDEESGVPPESAKTNPALAPYVTGWAEKAGDLGFLAMTPNGSAVGAAWVRLMPADWPLYRYVDSNFPELAIAVLPNYLGRGMGSELLRALVEATGRMHPGIVLSVRGNNPAKRLYERFGFRTIAGIKNRVGGTSFVMKLDLR